jgi:hypothetical protein
MRGRIGCSTSCITWPSLIASSVARFRNIAHAAPSFFTSADTTPSTPFISVNSFRTPCAIW